MFCCSSRACITSWRTKHPRPSGQFHRHTFHVTWTWTWPTRGFKTLLDEFFRGSGKIQASLGVVGLEGAAPDQTQLWHPNWKDEISTGQVPLTVANWRAAIKRVTSFPHDELLCFVLLGINCAHIVLKIIVKWKCPYCSKVPNPS